MYDYALSVVPYDRHYVHYTIVALRPMNHKWRTFFFFKIPHCQLAWSRTVIHTKPVGYMDRLNRRPYQHSALVGTIPPPVFADRLNRTPLPLWKEGLKVRVIEAFAKVCDKRWIPIFSTNTPWRIKNLIFICPSKHFLSITRDNLTLYIRIRRFIVIRTFQVKTFVTDFELPLAWHIVSLWKANKKSFSGFVTPSSESSWIRT